MKETEFVIIVPAYNAEKYLERTIRSVTSQEYPAYRIVVVDDGSNDATAEIAGRFASQDDRIAVIRQENQGQIMARSAGISYALEDCADPYFLFLDADDEFKPGSLHRIDELLRETGCDMLIFGAETFDDRIGKTLGMLSGSAEGLVDAKPQLYQVVLYDFGYNSLCRKAIPRRAIEATDYSAYAHLRNGEDLIQSLDYYRYIDSVYFTKEVFYRYHMVDASVTHRVDFYSYPIDSAVRRLTWEFVVKENVWSDRELSDYAQFLLDMLERKVAALCCFRAPFSDKTAVFDAVKRDEFYAMLLSMDLEHGAVIRLLLNGRYREMIRTAKIKKVIRRIGTR